MAVSEKITIIENVRAGGLGRLRVYCESPALILLAEPLVAARNELLAAR